MKRAAALFLFCVGLAVGVEAAGQPSPGADLSILHREFVAREQTAWDAFPAVPFRTGIVHAGSARPTTVFGYLPYWKVGDVTLQMDLLTHLAYFGVSIAGDGTLGDWRHWGGPAMDNIIAGAHDSGITVVVTVTSFSAADQSELLSSPAARTAAVENIVNLVVKGGGDGVNIDFEGLPVTSKADFVSFVAEIKTALDTAVGNSSVTLATPAVDWRGAYDYDALAESSDGLVIMGYDYHYPGGSPGPVCPLSGSTKWGEKSIVWTLDDYDRWGGTENRHKFILGLPLYGYDWPADAPPPPSASQGEAVSVSWALCQSRGKAEGRSWDVDSSSPWYDYDDAGQYRQVWCDTSESLKLRFEAARDRGIAGVGFWALGYEAADESPWTALTEVFRTGVDVGDADDVAERAESAEIPADSETAESVESSPDAVPDAAIGIDCICGSDLPEADESGSNGGETTVTDKGFQSDLSGGTDPADFGLKVDVFSQDSGPVRESDRHGGCSSNGSLPESGPGPGAPGLFIVLSIAFAALILCRVRPILSPRGNSRNSDPRRMPFSKGTYRPGGEFGNT